MTERENRGQKRGPYKKYEVDVTAEQPTTTKWRKANNEASTITLDQDLIASYTFTEDSGTVFTDVDDSDPAKPVFHYADDTDYSDFEDSSTMDMEEEDNKDDDIPLYPGSRLTVGASMLLLVTFVLRHGLTGTALLDLLGLVELHCLVPNMCRSTMRLYKDFFMRLKSPIEFHHFCGFCKNYIGKEKPSECDICHRSKDILYFVVIPLLQQLEGILKKPGLLESFGKWRRARCQQTDNIYDIYDGKLYKQHFNADGFFKGTPESRKVHELHLSLQINTDGVSLFRSSKFNVWPIYATINELKPEARVTRENRLFLGLWFGNGKPDMKSFLKPIVDDILSLYNKGLKLNVDGSEKLVRCILHSVIADAPARCLMLDLVQFNGNYGCPCCYMKGSSCSTSARGHSHVYPYDIENIDEGHSAIRTDQETIIIGKEVEKKYIASNRMDAVPYKGVKGVSVLTKLPRFDIIRGTTVDYMHCVLLGVTKMLVGLWIDAEHRNCPWSIRNRIAHINSRLSTLAPPNIIHRIPRSFDDLPHWKASELGTFLLFCLPLLWGILPDPYYQHSLFLSEALYICLKDSISSADLRKAKKLITAFCIQVEELYGERYETFNVHSLLHLTSKVEDLGPLWAHSCFFYEDLNGDLRKLFHGSQQVGLQITLAVCIQQKIPELVQSIEYGSPAWLLYEKMTKPHRLTDNRMFITENIQVIGPVVSCCLSSDIEKLTESQYGNIYEYSRFLRIKHGRCVIHSEEYNVVTRRNSFCVTYGDHQFGLVRYYIRCGQSNGYLYLAVIQKLLPYQLPMDMHKLTKDSHFIVITKSDIIDIVKVSDIHEMCFYINVPREEHAFVAQFPNFYVSDC